MNPEAVSKTRPKTFSARLTHLPNSLNWVIVTLPFDSVKTWGKRGGLRVVGTINGFEFRTSLFPTGKGQHFFVINKAMQRGGRVRPGETAKFQLAPDPEKRVVPVAPEIDRILKTSKALRKFYDSLTPSARNDIARFVAEPKQAETRVRRAEQLAERLMETLEAEIDLPPLLKQVFARRPGAMEGWRLMPQSHRRRHLLGIFYYRDFDARMRRIEKALVEIEAYAEKSQSRQGRTRRPE
jgi:uncharacterized protein YdeI (YjbR/CyaY-like superfamily)